MFYLEPPMAALMQVSSDQAATGEDERTVIASLAVSAACGQ